MSGTATSILLVIALFGVTFLYITIKKKAKQEIFFKDQYKEQKNLTENAYLYKASATEDAVRAALKKHIPTDDSFSANFVGGNCRIAAQNDNSITYLHTAKITTGGNGDEFTASVTFGKTESGVDVLAQIVSFRVKDGVTRKAGIQAMQDFFDSVRRAVTEADPNASSEIIKK